jgi:hypothetical protein
MANTQPVVNMDTRMAHPWYWGPAWQWDIFPDGVMYYLVPDPLAPTGRLHYT